MIELLITGWLVIDSINPGPKESLYTLKDPVRNYLLTVELPDSRALGLASLGYKFEEGSNIRIAAWASCTEIRDEYRQYLCTTTEDRFKELPCRANEGIWIAGIQYC